jgi:hypothetical protein
VYIPVHNPTEQPVVIDAEGRIIGGGEWGTVLTTEPAAKEAIDAGRLVRVAAYDDTTGLDPAAAQALQEAAELEDARKDGPEELAEAADRAGATKTKSAAKAAAQKEA